MERGGFHGYQKTPNANSGTEGLKLSEINYMRLSEMNQNGMGKNTNIVVNNNNWTTTNGDVESECTVREQDRFMPIANVIRIMRRILPAHAKISDDAKETIQECVSEYISFITGEANERCQKEQRKTITAEDVLWAMSKLGFDDYIEPLTVYLHRHREMEGERGSIRSEPTAANLMMMKRAMGDHYGSAGTFAAFHVGHHHHHHHHGGFFGYLKDSSAIPNAAAAAASTSSSHASQQPAGAAVTNGDHQPHAHAHFK